MSEKQQHAKERESSTTELEIQQNNKHISELESCTLFFRLKIKKTTTKKVSAVI